MKPREIELLTIAKLEHEGHSITPADQREIHRTIHDGIKRKAKFRSMMSGDSFQWQKPSQPRR